MIKRIFLGMLAVFLLAGASYGAAPTIRNVYSSTGDVVVDSQYTGAWECMDSLIVACSDSASTVITVSGWAIMSEGARLYIGFGNDSANRISASNTNPHSNLDTTLIFAPTERMDGLIYMPILARYVSVTNGANTDTFYVNGAVKGSDAYDEVKLYDVYVTAEIADQ